MADTKIAAIMRAGAYSPNHIANDATILSTVAEQLRKRGCEVTLYSEEQLIAGKVQERIIINMCRERRSTDLLQRMEDAGTIVINSGYGIENCTRERQTRILIGSNIPYPDSLVVSTDEVIKNQLVKKQMSQCWIKRGDNYAMHKEDVSYVRTADEAQEVLQEYFLRGIKRAVISRHLRGDLVKFYGVVGSPFFYWYYPFDMDHNKHQVDEMKAMEKRIKELCTRAAEELNIIVYGGDAIIDAEGNVTLIDFNDWPSFAPCRAAAATAIAKAVMSEIKRRKVS